MVGRLPPNDSYLLHGSKRSVSVDVSCINKQGGGWYDLEFEGSFEHVVLDERLFTLLLGTDQN